MEGVSSEKEIYKVFTSQNSPCFSWPRRMVLQWPDQQSCGSLRRVSSNPFPVATQVSDILQRDHYLTPVCWWTVEQLRTNRQEIENSGTNTPGFNGQPTDTICKLEMGVAVRSKFVSVYNIDSRRFDQPAKKRALQSVTGKGEAYRVFWNYKWNHLRSAAKFLDTGEFDRNALTRVWIHRRSSVPLSAALETSWLAYFALQWDALM